MKRHLKGFMIILAEAVIFTGCGRETTEREPVPEMETVAKHTVASIEYTGITADSFTTTSAAEPKMGTLYETGISGADTADTQADNIQISSDTAVNDHSFTAAEADTALNDRDHLNISADTGISQSGYFTDYADTADADHRETADTADNVSP